MDLHRGRLLDHLHLRVKDLEASRRFYQACMDVLGIPLDVADDHISCDELWIDEGPDEVRSHAHFAFQAKDEETVRRWHAAVLAAGGRDNGAPGERSYHPGYYAAFALDPDGNNVEAVYHGPHHRSGASVEISV